MYETKAIMSTDVVAVNRGTPIGRVIELLVENDITGIPVVDDEERLVGIVTEKDVMGVLSGRDDILGSAKDYMTKDVVSFDEDDDLIAICESLVNNHFRRVPILSHGRLVGIVSRRDLIKYIMEPIGPRR
jgi:CBS domain-containing protein